MAWQISATGTREGVIKIIQAAKPLTPEADTAQLDAAKPLFVAEVNALPADCNGCRFDASGDSQKNGRQMQLSVLPIKLAV